MRRQLVRTLLVTCVLGLVLGTGPAVLSTSVQAQGKAAPPQKIDAEYTAKIKEYTQDTRILTELRADNDASLRFYLRLGFEIVGVAHDLARLGGRFVDVVIVEKDI